MTLTYGDGGVSGEGGTNNIGSKTLSVSDSVAHEDTENILILSRGCERLTVRELLSQSNSASVVVDEPFGSKILSSDILLSGDIVMIDGLPDCSELVEVESDVSPDVASPYSPGSWFWGSWNRASNK